MRYVITIVVFILALMAGNAFASGIDCVDYEQAAHWVGGQRFDNSSYKIGLSGDVLYSISGSTIRIFNIQDPVRPEVVGEIQLPGQCGSVLVEGDIMACATRLGTVLFDVQTPSMPQIFWQDNTVDRATIAIDSGRFYQVAEDRLEIFKVSVGESPILLGSIEVPQTLKLLVAGNMAYLHEAYGVRGYDISDPVNIVPCGYVEIELGWGLKKLGVINSRVVATSVHNISGGVLSVINFSDPDHPFVSATLSLNSGYVAGLAFDGDVAVVTSGNEIATTGFVLVDLSDPDQPQWLGRCDTVYSPFDTLIQEPGRLVISMRSGFGVFDITTRQVANELAFEWAPEPVWGSVIYHEYLYTATTGGLVVWSLSDPTSPEIMTGPLWGDDLRCLVADVDMLYAGAQSGQVIGVSISNPETPVQVESYSALDNILGLSVTDDWVAAACGTSGLALFRRGPGWNQPPTAMITSTVEWGNVISDVRDVAIHDSVLVVADNNYGVVTFTISPDGELDLSANQRGLAPVNTVVAVDGLVYAAGGTNDYQNVRRNQLNTLSLQSNGQLTLIDSQQVPVGVQSSMVLNDVLYLGMNDFGVFCYTLEVPDMPELLGGVATRYLYGQWEIRDFCVGPDHVYLAAQDGGIRILPAHCPASLVEPVSATRNTQGLRKSLSLAPNPFNPKTNIFFDTQHAGAVDLAVFDLRGNHICTLVDDDFEAGSHEVSWGGRDSTGRLVPSGIYIARLIAPNENVTTTMTLVR